MNDIRIGSTCTGYAALDRAVENVFGGQMVWYSEFEKWPSHLLSKRFPDVPNLGDLTKIDWTQVPEIDILTGGIPCQPFSQAGLGKGINDSRHLWPHIREAIRVLRPRLTILENVAGFRSRGLPYVLQDLAEDGLTARWVSVRASDIGAPHRRERIFLAITDPYSWGLEWLSQRNVGAHEPGLSAPLGDDVVGRGLAPADAYGEQREERVLTEPSEKGHGSADLGLSPVPDAEDHGRPIEWGKYEPAVRRWERLTRPAPNPVRTNRNGNPALSPAFVEWMMGQPEGWFTDPALGIPIGAQLKLAGNGVVTQQAEAAVRQLLTMT